MFEIDELQDWKFLLCDYQGQGLIKFQSVNKIDKKSYRVMFFNFKFK